MAEAQFFGTLLKPNVRWTCHCGSKNVNNLIVPLLPMTRIFCKKCHKPTDLTVDLKRVPRVWGGSLEPEVSASENSQK